jgi:hypothetical protein
MDANKPSTEPKLTIVPEDGAAAHAFMMERVREIIAIHAECGGDLSTLQLEGWTADDRRDLDKTMLFLERLELGLRKGLKARGDKGDDQAR